MARRPKRQRTQAEIKAALKHNENVNKTPDGPEDPGERRKRKQRKTRAKRDLMKELAALSIAGDESAAPERASQVAVAVEQPTVEQEGKTEEDDPLEHQRRYAAAYAEGVRIAEAEAVQQVSSTLSSADRAAAERAPKAERQRIRRANMTASQKERTKAKNRERARASRAQRTDSQRAAAREADRIRKQKLRARQAPSHRAIELERNRLQHQTRRSEQTIEEQQEDRELNRERMAAIRASQTDEERAVSQATDRDQYATRSDALTEDAFEAVREQNRIRRKAVKHRHAHSNHVAFRISNVRGQHIVNGRHKLPPTTMCRLCHAWKWPDESEFICCMRGRVRLPPLRAAPPRLLEWYRDDKFRRNVRAYNQAFAFTSIGASSSDRRFREVAQDEEVAGQGGVYTYRIQGAMGHYLGSMLPYVDRTTGERTQPKFAQIYLVDPVMQERAKRRKSIYADLDKVALKDIEDMMERCNPFAQQFLNFGEKLRADLAKGIPIMDIKYKLHAKPSQPGTHNLPTVSEVGAVVVTDGNIPRPRDLLLYAKDQQLLRLFETDEKYDPLQYPLLFPYGDLGWTYSNLYADGAKYRKKRKMALREHTAYRLFQKDCDQSALFQGGRLFQQWVVDQRAKCEQEQLRWVATHQKEIRADQYHGVQDALINETTVALGEGEAIVSEFNRDTGELVHPDRRRSDQDEHFLGQIGKRVILPDSHVGGPRYMYKAYQDLVAIVREYGKPGVFLTKTCNPKWEEIM